MKVCIGGCGQRITTKKRSGMCYACEHKLKAGSPAPVRETCAWCSEPVKMRYPGSDPENGPARMACPFACSEYELTKEFFNKVYRLVMPGPSYVVPAYATFPVKKALLDAYCRGRVDEANAAQGAVAQ